MPPRGPPKIYQIFLKTHKLSIFITATPTSTIADLKQEALTALIDSVCEPLTAGTDQDQDYVFEPKMPQVHTTADFELCKVRRDKNTRNSSATAIDVHDILEGTTELRNAGFSGWQELFMRFRDERGALSPIVYTPPNDDDDDEPLPSMPAPSSPGPSTSKGKRKAPPG